MTDFKVKGGAALAGKTSVPADKSIGHRAIMAAALAEGTSTIRGFSGAADHLSTLACMQAMGVKAQHTGDTLTLEGVGFWGLRAPTQPLDCGNSGTTMRLLSGLLAPQAFATTLVGDASLMRRPMRRVVAPLEARGATIRGTVDAKGDLRPPLHIEGLVRGQAGARGQLRGGTFELPVSSAQVKSALLWSGLAADGPTCVIEPAPSRDHTERLFRALGFAIDKVSPRETRLTPPKNLAYPGFDVMLPGDPSSAAFPIVAALIAREGSVEVSHLCLNPTRIGFVEVLKRMGARLDVCDVRESGGEDIGTLRATASDLVGTRVHGAEIASLIDEIPVLAVAAALAATPTHFEDVAELRHKESDRIATTVAMLEAFGVHCEVRPDGFTVHPAAALRPAEVTSHGDHRIAMSGVVLASRTEGASSIRDVACVDTSFPGFAAVASSVGIDIATC